MITAQARGSASSLPKSIVKHLFTIHDAIEMVRHVGIVDEPLKKPRELPL